jgi:hypothetical protein
MFAAWQNLQYLCGSLSFTPPHLEHTNFLTPFKANPFFNKRKTVTPN